MRSCDSKDIGRATTALRAPPCAAAAALRESASRKAALRSDTPSSAGTGAGHVRTSCTQEDWAMEFLRISGTTAIGSPRAASTT